MRIVSDVGVVRQLQAMNVPFEAYEQLVMWGRWLRSEKMANRKSGIEGKLYRSNRCPACYEKPDPCPVCQHQELSGKPIDLEMALAIERVISGGKRVGGVFQPNMNKKDVTILIAHFRGIRNPAGEFQPSNPRVICRQLAMSVDDYDRHVARLVFSVWKDKYHSV